MVIISLLGGLGLFIYGMKIMGDGLENAAGEGLKNILEKVTKNPIIAVVVGAIVTAVIQSSSATTVMVVGFVNAGLMNLAQAAGIIMGANIGTTITAQLVAFKLTDIAPLFVFVGAMIVMFAKMQKKKEIGNIILGFGILFIGMGMMSEGGHVTLSVSYLKKSKKAGEMAAKIMKGEKKPNELPVTKMSKEECNYVMCTANLIDAGIKLISSPSKFSITSETF